MYNNELKDINSPEKAYLLGLFYSDGCIHSKDGSYCASIILHEDDKYLLDIIVTKFPFFRLSKMTNRAWAIVCTKKAIVEDLQANGMFFRKSTDNKELLRLPKLRSDLIHHFIRGYFDGDGSVYRQKQGNTKIDIGGTGYNMITDLVRVLYNNKITVNLTCKYAETGLRKHDYYVLYTSSDKISKKFADYIYKDCGELYMRRKYDRLYYIPEYHRLDRLVCPICNRTNTIRMGTRQMSYGLVYRGKCKDCKKQFSITAPQSSNTLSGEGELLEA
jgi:intein/homing endonuclease